MGKRYLLGMAPSSSIQRPKRKWHSVLATLIAFALVLSFFHGWSADLDDALMTVAAAQVSCDANGKSSPDTGAPHGDHCLSHVTSVALHDNAATVEYVTRVIDLAIMLTPDVADLPSPFKPPRA
jgi:hypothetical protein